MMKKFLLLASLALAGILHGQTLVNVQKSGAPANAISGDLVFVSGRTLTMAAGSHLVLASGTFSPGAASIPWSALTGQPTTLAGYGITDPIVLTSGSYANPSWITSLAASKLTGSFGPSVMPAFSGDATSSAGSTVLTLAASGVTLGTYGTATTVPVITFDAKGRATGATTVTIAPAFASITSKPTTAAGYGITNGANIDAWGAKTIPSGTVADLSSVQVFSNKSISGAANTLSNIPTSTLIGALPAANFPALTGDVTVTAATLVTAYNNVVPSSKGGAGAVTGILKANGSGGVSAAVSGTDYQAAGSYITALTGDGTAAGPGSSALTVTKLNGTSLAGLATGILKNTTGTGVPSIAAAGSDYQTPLTFGTGLTNSSGTVTVNTSQAISKLSNLTTNGFVKTGSGDGTLSIDTSTYLTGNQTITISGDSAGTGATSITTTVTKLNGTSLASLATGLLKNTTGTGVPSISIAGTDYVAPGGAGSLSGLTNRGAVYATSANTVSSTGAMTNGQVLVGSTGSSPVAANITGTAAELTVTNGAGTIGLSLPSALTFTGKTITGGTFTPTNVDGPIGQNTPAVGTFTNLISSGGAFNGTVGQTTPAAGTFTALSSTSGAFNGTVGQTTPGLGTFTTLVANTAAVGTNTTQVATTAYVIAERTATATLTNKTLTAPVIATISNSGTLTLPTSTDTLLGRATTDTVTNKRITIRTSTITSNSAPSINTDTTDEFTITALAGAVTSFTTNLSGTPVNGDMLMVRIKDDGTARAMTWGASFRQCGATPPVTTVVSKTLYVLFIWNSTDSIWDCVSTAQQF